MPSNFEGRFAPDAIPRPTAGQTGGSSVAAHAASDGLESRISQLLAQADMLQRASLAALHVDSDLTMADPSEIVTTIFVLLWERPMTSGDIHHRLVERGSLYSREQIVILLELFQGSELVSRLWRLDSTGLYHPASDAER